MAVNRRENRRRRPSGPALRSRRRQRGAEVPDDPVDLDEQGGVVEPLTLEVIALGGLARARGRRGRGESPPSTHRARRARTSARARATSASSACPRTSWARARTAPARATRSAPMDGIPAWDVPVSRAWSSRPREMTEIADGRALEPRQHLLVARRARRCGADRGRSNEPPRDRCRPPRPPGRRGARGSCGPGAATPRSAPSTTAPAARNPSSRATSREAVRQPIERLAGVDEPRGRQHERRRRPPRPPRSGCPGRAPARALVVRRHGREHHEDADGHLPRRGARQAQHELGDAERDGHEQGHGQRRSAPRASPMARARSTPRTTAALRWSAVLIEARTETCTTTSAVSGASTGRGRR